MNAALVVKLIVEVLHIAARLREVALAGGMTAEELADALLKAKAESNAINERWDNFINPGDVSSDYPDPDADDG